MQLSFEDKQTACREAETEFLASDTPKDWDPMVLKKTNTQLKKLTNILHENNIL